MKQQIKWFASKNNTEEWQRFDNDESKILQATSKGDANKKSRALTTIITSFASEWIDHVVVRQKNDPYSKNWREIQIKNIHQEFRALEERT